MHLRLFRGDLLIGVLLVVAAKRSHGGGCDEFTDVGDQTLAILVPPIGPEGKGGVPQAAKVAHGLAVGSTSKLGLLQDGLFELGIADLAIRPGRCRDKPAHEHKKDEKSGACHQWSNLHKRGAPKARTPVTEERLRQCLFGSIGDVGNRVVY